ncbi:MAG TPA: hypothetical protein VLB04_03715 [Methanotrichaceae archaeon]|nr:hypothetical protein [Methanotrichaceae archaeon]
MANILVGAAIILVPLGLFLLVMARDLSSEEEGLMRRVAKLRRKYSSMKSGTRADSSIAYSTDLDEDDAKLIQNIAAKLKADKTDNKKAGNLASAFNKAIRIRDGERIILNRKIKNFKMYSIMVMLVICASLGLLLFISASKP